MVYGVSDNEGAWWRNPQAAQIGFVARDSAQAAAGQVAGQDPFGGPPKYPLQGGKRAAYGLLEGDARLCARR